MIRNIGGRITPGLLEQLGLLGANRRSCRGDSWRRWRVSTSSYSNTLIAASLRSLPAIPLCWRAIFRYRKRNSRRKRSPIPRRRLPLTFLCCGRFGIAGEWLVFGLVYDVATGLVEIVAPAALHSL